MAFFRFIIVFFGLLTALYFAISLYSRSIRREKLENEWAEEHPGDDESPEREAFLEDGMRAYQHGLRRKLLWLVYIIPTIAVVVILVITNAN